MDPFSQKYVHSVYIILAKHISIVANRGENRANRYGRDDAGDVIGTIFSVVNHIADTATKFAPLAKLFI